MNIERGAVGITATSHCILSNQCRRKPSDLRGSPATALNDNWNGLRDAAVDVSRAMLRSVCCGCCCCCWFSHACKQLMTPGASWRFAHRGYSNQLIHNADRLADRPRYEIWRWLYQVSPSDVAMTWFGDSIKQNTRTDTGRQGATRVFFFRSFFILQSTSRGCSAHHFSL